MKRLDGAEDLQEHKTLPLDRAASISASEQNIVVSLPDQASETPTTKVRRYMVQETARMVFVIRRPASQYTEPTPGLTA